MSTYEESRSLEPRVGGENTRRCPCLRAGISGLLRTESVNLSRRDEVLIFTVKRVSSHRVHNELPQSLVRPQEPGSVEPVEKGLLLLRSLSSSRNRHDSSTPLRGGHLDRILNGGDRGTSPRTSDQPDRRHGPEVFGRKPGLPLKADAYTERRRTTLGVPWGTRTRSSRQRVPNEYGHSPRRWRPPLGSETP